VLFRSMEANGTWSPQQGLGRVAMNPATTIAAISIPAMATATSTMWLERVFTLGTSTRCATT
jgi:hypothetical protein